MYIAVTGFYGTGSSAVIDLLSGDSNFTTTFKDDYEHCLLYMPDGLFDLEWKLLYNNDIHRSNEALSSFEKAMKRLNDNNFGWFGSFKNLYGDEFNNIVKKNINSIIDYKTDLIPFYEYKTVRFSFIKIILQFFAKNFQGKKIHKWGRQYVYYKNSEIQRISIPNEDKFYNFAKSFTSDYAKMVSENSNKNIIFDHLILPQHLNRINNFFNKDFKFIYVDRDPRDLFVSAKYLWKTNNVFADNVDKFCEQFKKLRKNINVKGENILKIHFEDLIYNNQVTINNIENFLNIKLNIDENIFKPEKSINNTQCFLINDDWNEEIKYIENNLNEYIYNFPYIRIPQKKEIFE